MSLLAIKLIVTPLIVLAATLAARRWGDAVGGWLVGLPLTSGPVSVFLALERGPAFAAHAADGSLAGVVAQAAFCFGYAALARRGQRRRSSPERWPMALSRPCSSMPDYRPSPCFSPRS